MRTQETRHRVTVSPVSENPSDKPQVATPASYENASADSKADVSPDSGRSRAFMQGCKSGLPVFLGYAPIGMAFGILARAVGFSVAEAGICSATALAGAGQFIALSVLKTGADALSVLIATTVVNLRYVLFATTLSPQLHGVRTSTLGWLGFTLTDETFAVNIVELREGKASPASMAGVGAIAWAGWVSGTVAGAAAASWIGDPTRFGVEFAMAAMFSALFVALAEDWRHVVVGIAAAVITLLVPLLSSVGLNVPASWNVVIASMTAATLATWVIRDA